MFDQVIGRLVKFVLWWCLLLETLVLSTDVAIYLHFENSCGIFSC